jgi:S1-C subfamily serine protease
LNTLDIIILLMLAFAALGGWRVGLIARLASWIGGLGGLYLAIRLMPVLLRQVSAGAPGGRLLLVVGGVLFGGALGGALGEFAGRRIRSIVPPGPLRTFDHAGGSVIGAVGVIASIWLLVPALSDVPGPIAREARSSKVVTWVNRTLPRPPDATQALRSLVGESGFPQVFANLRPAPDTGPPPATLPMDPALLARVTASTVNVEVQGCGAIHEGSGFTVASDTVVTNAHVVAGGTRVRVRRPDQRVFNAQVVVFDSHRDLAVLQAPGLGEQPLTIASIKPGAQGVVVGYPGGQNTPRPTPALVRDEAPTQGYDIYNRDQTVRQVLFLAAALRPGDSGSPLFDTQGRVVGVAFAIAPDRPSTAYALADVELRAALAAPRRPGTGACIA